jgi:hypothetical protein
VELNRQSSPDYFLHQWDCHFLIAANHRSYGHRTGYASRFHLRLEGSRRETKDSKVRCCATGKDSPARSGGRNSMNGSNQRQGMGMNRAMFIGGRIYSSPESSEGEDDSPGPGN